MPARTAMIAITTSSSMRVNAERFMDFEGARWRLCEQSRARIPQCRAFNGSGPQFVRDEFRCALPGSLPRSLLSDQDAKCRTYSPLANAPTLGRNAREFGARGCRGCPNQWGAWRKPEP